MESIYMSGIPGIRKGIESYENVGYILTPEILESGKELKDYIHLQLQRQE